MTLPLQITDEFGAAVRTLVANYHLLPAKDRDFAVSLLHGWSNHLERGWRFSEKQAEWIVKLAARSTGDVPRRESVSVGDLSGLLAIFKRAGEKLKRPSIVALAPNGKEIKLSVAGQRSSRPGTINVAENAPFGEGEWYGRITAEGEFEPSARSNGASLTDWLREFAADPAKTAAKSGHLTGKCCFCNRKLDDERSTAVGYGPVCADNYGLHYPTAKEARNASPFACDEAA